MVAMIKAVIYDLDDLMVNSYEIHVRATNLLLKQHGVDADTIPEEVSRRFVGMRVSDILKTIIFHLNLNVDFENLYEVFANTYNNPALEIPDWLIIWGIRLGYLNEPT